MKATKAATRISGDSVFENLPVAAVVLGQGKEVLAANRLARRLTRVTPAASRKTCREWLRCVLPETQCPLRRARKKGGFVKRAEIPVRIGGRPGWVIERVALWRDLRTGRRLTTLIWGPATPFHRRWRLLLRQAHGDGLTKLLNRRGFDEAALRSLHRRHEDRRAAFLMIDVDGLKSINDRCGHAAGDKLLVRLARAIRGCLRRTDVSGRVGGDEFAVYCPGATRGQAVQLAGRLRSALIRDNRARTTQPPLTASIGVAWARRAGFAALRRTADRSLYRVKRRRVISRVGSWRAPGRGDPSPRA